MLYFPEDGGAVLPFFWAPADRLQEREHTDKVPYPLWAREGLLEAPAGRAINRLAIIHRLAELASTFDIKGIAYDRWRLEDLKNSWLTKESVFRLPRGDKVIRTWVPLWTCWNRQS